MARQLLQTIDTKSQNLLLNSDMRFAQRGTSIAGTGGFQYLLDRWVGWFPNPSSGTSPTLSQSSLPSGFPGVNESGLAFRAQTTVNTLSPSPSINRQQRIESLRLEAEAGSTISVGFWGWASTMQQCQIQILNANAKDNWASSTVIQTIDIPVADSAWKYYSLENVTIPNNNGIEIRIAFYDPSGTAFADTYVTEVMCNKGPKVQPWSLAEKDSDRELHACYRYYEICPIRFRAALTSGSIEATYCFKKTKRVTPSMIILGGSITVNRTTINSVSFSNTTAASGNADAAAECEL